MDRVQQKVCLSGELAAIDGFLSDHKFAQSIPSLNFQKLSSDCDKAVWHWIVLGPLGQAKLELYKYLLLFKSAIRLVLVFLRIVQVPESVASFATLVAVQSLSELPSTVTSHEPHRDIRSSQSHFSYSTRVLKSFS